MFQFIKKTLIICFLIVSVIVLGVLSILGWTVNYLYMSFMKLLGLHTGNPS